MGASVAYYLSKKGVQATLYESSAIGSGASGKSGGFLARDWCQGVVSELAKRSFDLHAQLSTDLNADTQYRRVNAYSLQLVACDDNDGACVPGSASVPEELQWLNGAARPRGKVQQIGSKNDCTQVIPKLLTEVLLAEAGRLASSRVERAHIERIVRRPGDGSGSEAGWEV